MKGGPSALDPADWAAFRAEAHRILDEVVDDLACVGEGPVWRPMTSETRAGFEEPVPKAPMPLGALYDVFARSIRPHGAGNRHPRFFGWVHGGGTALGAIAELLAGSLNANLGGRDHAPIAVERQIVRWMRELFGFPGTASGLLVTGTSMANLLAVIVARTDRLGVESRAQGMAGHRLVAYTSSVAHACVERAMEVAGLGSSALRRVPVGLDHRLDLAALERMIAEDRRDGLAPFLVVGTAGSVDIGATDDLSALADLAARERLWFHVDGAFGAFGVLSDALRPRLAGIERADSIACDFHKWLQVPYDAGFLLVRDEAKHRAAFAQRPPYLARTARGLAAGEPWFTDYGVDLSRGFRALKVWFALKGHGTEALGRAIDETCRVAAYAEARVRREDELEMHAPVPMNIVCFGYRAAEGADEINRRIVIELQESGAAAPSTTTLGGRLAIRAAIVNHRTREADIDAFIDAVLAAGRRFASELAPRREPPTQ